MTPRDQRDVLRVVRREHPDAAPAHLSREAAAWWVRFTADWALDPAARLILQTGLEAFDRMRGAQRAVKRQGLTLKSGRSHPALVVERDARLAFLRCLRALNLDIEPLHDRPGRPGGS